MKFAQLAVASLVYLMIGTTGIVLIKPIHDSVLLLLFVSLVLVIQVVLMWRDIYTARRFTRYEKSI